MYLRILENQVRDSQEQSSQIGLNDVSTYLNYLTHFPILHSVGKFVFALKLRGCRQSADEAECKHFSTFQ